MRVAVIQFAAGRDKPANVVALRAAVAEAAAGGAELVVAPEAAMHPFGTPADGPLAAHAEPLDGPFVTGLADAAATAGVTVVAGMFESVPGDPGRAYNTVVALGPGGLVGRYRKLHLFDALGWRESDRLLAGELDDDALLTFPLGGFTVGVMTCYDVRFPELSRAYADLGVTLLALPSAWVSGPFKEEQWLTLVRARAIDGTAYVVAPNQCPPDSVGHSLVVDPIGVPVLQLAEAPAVGLAEVTPERVASVRERMPSLEHRRFRFLTERVSANVR